MSPRKFGHLKPGDLVLVVTQKHRFHNRRAEFVPLTRVGRRYGYVDRYSREQAFDLKTGQSIHSSNSNVRSYGGGFDVFLGVDDFRRAEVELANDRALRAFLRDAHYSSVLNGSPALMADMITLLQRHGAIPAPDAAALLSDVEFFP